MSTTKTSMLAVLLLLLAPFAPGMTTETKSDATAIATRLLDHLDAGDYAAATTTFSAQMKAALGVDKLQQVQQQLTTAGAVKSRDPAKISQQSGMTVVVIRIHRAMASIDATIAVDGDGKVAGLHFAPAPPPAAAAPTADANYSERDLRVGDGERALPGTLAMPKTTPVAQVPAVVLVHGSGPQDRDETIGPNRPFLDIARGLATKGIAVLRYDKRTKARPQDFADGEFSIDDETTDDAVAAVAALRKLPGIDPTRVFVLGHSQGGMLAPRIAQRSDAVAGLILLAAPSRPLLDILIEQNRRLAAIDGTVSEAERQAIDALVGRIERLRSGEDVAATESPLGLPATYWRSVEAVDPVADAHALTQPMLLLQGGRDFQVVEADWRRWQGAFDDSPRATLKHYPALNHLGIAGTGPSSLADYQTPGHVDPRMIADITAWIDRH